MAVEPINLFEFEALARQRLPGDVCDFIAGGSTDEITLRRTRQVFDTIVLRPRVLVDISELDASTTVLGNRLDVPVMIAPSGFHGRVHPDGELATVRAAAEIGTVAVMSTASSYVLEDIAREATGPIWFQMQLFRDRGLTRELADRATDAGFGALCITLDSAVRAKRERNIRNDYTNPPAPNLQAVEVPADRWDGSLDPRGAGGLIDRTATWADLDWLAEWAPVPLVFKGIMTAEDSALAADHGAQAVIVSNHGARNLDTTLSTIEVLPEVVEAVGDRVEVYLDGGIMRGTDVLKALARGARAVLIGRAALWGLAVDGEAGLRTVLGILSDELKLAMAMCGRPSVGAIDAGVLAQATQYVHIAPHRRAVSIDDE